MILEQKLEETHEELQRVTEAESLLRSRCACLEGKQRRGKDQIQVAPHDIIFFKTVNFFLSLLSVLISWNCFRQ